MFGHHPCQAPLLPGNSSIRGLFIPPSSGWLRMGTLAHPWAVTALGQRATVCLRSLGCWLVPDSGQERRRMERPTAKTAFFPCTALGCCRTDQGGCLERAGTLSLCLRSTRFQTRHFGRKEIPSSSRLDFPGGSMPSHGGLSSEA